jgi:hypothetical protein
MVLAQDNGSADVARFPRQLAFFRIPAAVEQSVRWAACGEMSATPWRELLKYAAPQKLKSGAP